MKLPAILSSKKGQAMILGLLTLILKNVIGLSDEDAMKVIGLVGTYLIGQGVADHGKEQAKIEHEAPKEPPKP